MLFNLPRAIMFRNKKRDFSCSSNDLQFIVWNEHQKGICVFFLVVAMLINVPSSAQQVKRGNIWFFGQHEGFDFKTDPPTKLNGGQVDNVFSRSSTISDENGNLLFYTDGLTVWNKRHQIMQNGTGLTIDESFYSIPSVIVPDPSDNRLYYIFTANVWNTPVAVGLHYARVDVSANASQGSVLQKNMDLLNPCSEVVCAVGHANGSDYWVIGHEYFSNKFYAYLISEHGISSPVVSAIGSLNIGGTHFDAGQMTISPDGTMIAVAANSIQLFDFDANTGVVSNPRTITSLAEQYEGVSFSPNSTVLYATATDGNVTQFDLSSSSENDINKSAVIVGQATNSVLSDLQLASNGQIYGSFSAGDSRGSLITIRNPDALGDKCNFDLNGIPITSFVVIGLPTSIQSFYRTPLKLLTSPTCEQDTARIVVSSMGYADSVFWDYGDSRTLLERPPLSRSQSHIYQQPGSYNVKFTKYIGNIQLTTDTTLTIEGKPFVYLGRDTTFCQGQSIQLSVSNLPKYNWSNGDTTSSMTVSAPGTYWLHTNTEICSNADTINISMLNYPVKSLHDTVTCLDQAELKAISNSNYSYIWSTGAPSDKITVNQSGEYSVRIANQQCVTVDSASVYFAKIEGLSMDPQKYSLTDTLDSSVLLEALGNNVDNWVWSFGDGLQESTTDPSVLHRYSAGSYNGKVVATNKWSCSAEAEFVVQVPYLEFIPNVFTPNDDQKNDVFQIVYTGDWANYSLSIYNRYGKLVFHSVDPENHWNAEGEPSDVYYYYFILDDRQRRGWVQVLK